MNKFKLYIPAILLAFIYLFAYWGFRQTSSLNKARPTPTNTPGGEGPYYEGETVFILRIREPGAEGYKSSDEVVQLNAKVLAREEEQPRSRVSRELLKLQDQATGKTINFILDHEISDSIHLDPATAYTISYQKIMGWPAMNGLMISDADGLVFLGVTDVDIDSDIQVQTLSPIKVRQTRLMEDHYILGSECWSRKTNAEIQFSSGNQVIRLHQGQSQRLDIYQVHLLIAQKVEYINNCPDSGEDTISFVIYRINE